MFVCIAIFIVLCFNRVKKYEIIDVFIYVLY